MDFLLSQHQLSLAGCLIDLAGSTFRPTGNWLPNLCLAGNPPSPPRPELMLFVDKFYGKIEMN